MEIVETVFSDLSEALKLRNNIFHGQLGIQGSGAGDRVEAHISAELKGSRRNISFTELNMTLKFLSCASWFMKDISYAAQQPDSAQLDDLYSRIRIRIEESRT